MKLFGKKLSFSLGTLLFFVALVHAALFVYDLTAPDVLINADHGYRRLRFIQGLLENTGSAADLQAFVTSHWIIGDYAIQGVVYGLVGPYGLIIFQILLALLSIVCLFKLTLLASESPKIALLAATVYAFLPHTLVYPHLLASEAIFVPLIVFSFYFVGRYLVEKRRLSYLLLSALMIGLANVVRPVSALWPVLAVVIAAITLRSAFRIRDWIGYLALAALPLVLWMSFMRVSTGEFSMGRGSASLGSNLYTTVFFISKTLPDPERAQVEGQYLTYGKIDGGESLSISDYVRFAVEHPKGYMGHQMRAAMMFFAKSGINKITKSYLLLVPDAFSEIDDVESGQPWRARLEQEGLLSTFVYYYEKWSMLVLLAAVAGILFAVMMAVALVGVVSLAGRYVPAGSDIGRRCLYALIAVFPLYVLLASLSSQRLQSRHRAPAEFAICLLFSIGAHHLYGLWRKVRVARPGR